MKTESQTRKQMEDANSKLREIEKRSRTAKNHYDRIVNERAWKQQNGYIEA